MALGETQAVLRQEWVSVCNNSQMQRHGFSSYHSYRLASGYPQKQFSA
jgi:hypothetical protein